MEEKNAKYSRNIGEKKNLMSPKFPKSIWKISKYSETYICKASPSQCHRLHHYKPNTYIYYRLFLGVEKAPTNTAPGRFLRSDGRFLRSIWALSQVYGRFLRSDGRFLRSDGRFLRSEGRVGQGMVGVDGVWWWGSMKMLGFTSIPLIAVSSALVTVF